MTATGTNSARAGLVRRLRRRLRLRTRLRRLREAFRAARPRRLPRWAAPAGQPAAPPTRRVTELTGGAVVADPAGANPRGRQRYGPPLPTGQLRLAGDGHWQVVRDPDRVPVVAGRVGWPLDERQSAVLAQLAAITWDPGEARRAGHRTGRRAPPAARPEARPQARPDAPAWAAELLVQLAMTGVVVHAPALPRSKQGRLPAVAPQLAALLAEPLPAADVDPMAWEIRSIQQRRLAMRHHAGLDQPPPVTAVLVTKRPWLVARAVARLAGQTYPELEIVLGRHGQPPAADPPAGGRPLRVVSVPEHRVLGEALSDATSAASGAIITKVDDDDWYGPEHIWDLVVARHYASTTVVGKGAEFVYLEPKDRTVRRRMAAETGTDTVAGGTIALARDDLAELGGWPAVPRSVDRALLDRVLAGGGSIYRTHPLGFIYTRHGDGHTWDPGLAYFETDPVRSWRGLPPYQEFGVEPA